MEGILPVQAYRFLSSWIHRIISRFVALFWHSFGADLSIGESRTTPRLTGDTPANEECDEQEVVVLTSLGDPGDALPSLGGAGTVEARQITKILEDAGICCCLVGVSALNYFGADRVRHDWEICVPTHLLERASDIFKSEPHNQTYEKYPPAKPQHDSLLHTFPRFKIKGVWFYFTLVPSEDAHLDCVPSNLEPSQMDLPYPKLHVFAQSLLETDDMVALTDLIDGMNLTEKWGLENLDLNGTNDVEWAERKNEKIRASVQQTETSFMLELLVSPRSKKETWERIVKTKENRIGSELSKEVFATRFYAPSLGDPRLRDRNYV